jgi:hypothetical protein
VTSEQATLLAAIIAAFSSLATLLMNIFASRSTEMRKAHRQILEPHITDLSQALYSTVATADILTKAKTEEAVENWRERAQNAQAKLKDLRCVLRYPLWGITDAMNTLTRLPDWIEHSRPFPQYSQKLLIKGSSLFDKIDNAVRRSYNNGRPPSFYMRHRVKKAEQSLIRTYREMKEDRSLTNEMTD